MRQLTRLVTTAWCCAALVQSVFSDVGLFAKEPPITALAVLDQQHLVAASRVGLQVVEREGLRTIHSQTLSASSIHRLIVAGKRVIAVGGQPAESGWAAILQCQKSGDSLTFPYTVAPLPGIAIFDDSIFDAELSPNGRQLLLASLDGQATVNDLGEKKPNFDARFSGHSSGVTGAVWLNETTVATSSRDTSIRVWKADSGQLVRTLNQHTGEVTLLERSPDSRLSSLSRPLVASAGLDNTVRFWQPTIGRLVRFCRLEKQTPSSMAWTPDGEALIVGTTAGKVFKINPATTEILDQWNVSQDWITALCAADQDTVFIGTAEGELRRLDL